MKKAAHKWNCPVRVTFTVLLLVLAYWTAFWVASHQSISRPPNLLFGRWQSKPTQNGLYPNFEFFKDGTVVESVFKPNTQTDLRQPEQLDRCARGTFRIIDATHLLVEVGPLLEHECPYWGAELWDEKIWLERVYQLDWLDDQHVTLSTGLVWPFGLRTGGETIELDRFSNH